MGSILSLALLLFLCSTPLVARLQVTAGQIEAARDSDGVQAYLGIPFAQAERWELPSQPTPWLGVQRFDQAPEPCIQANLLSGVVTGSEDCLKLNVLRPTRAQRELLPVVVFIHGGAFRSGAAPGVSQLRRLVGEGVMVVAPQYRLGPFGFFAHYQLEEKVANFAFLDLVLALEWVRDNARAFGGDPENVTLMGFSAGAEAVLALMVMEQSKGLFQRAIAMSGYATTPLPVRREALAPFAQQAAAEDSTDLFFRSIVPHSELVSYDGAALKGIEAAKLLHQWQSKFGAQLPIVDSVTLKDQIWKLFREGKQHDVPLITGAASFEALARGASIAMADALRLSPEIYASLLSIGKSGVERYCATPLSAEDKVQAMLFQQRYLRSAAMLGRWHEDSYLYYYDVVTADARGASHGDDLAALFGDSGPLGRQLRRHVANFARYGRPDTEAAWPAYRWRQDCWMIYQARSGGRTQCRPFPEKLPYFLQSLGERR